MKVKFWVEILGNNEAIFDIKALGYTEEEWKKLSEQEKDVEVSNWVHEKLVWGFVEIDGD